jgi:hypothetical protein
MIPFIFGFIAGVALMMLIIVYVIATGPHFGPFK